jgi:hypothetical protein
MENELVSYELALALKELGFNEPCYDNYNIYGKLWGLRLNKQVKIKGACLAPTYSQAFRFFREKFNWQASIEATKDQHSHELGYNYFIWNSETGLEYHTMPINKPSGDWEFKTYEEAEIACLMKLIEIAKNKIN